MKFELPPAKRRAFRAQAHHLEPVVMIGNDGLTPAVLHEIDVNLLSHGLIKIRVFSDDRVAREGFLDTIVDALDAAAVQHIGKLLIVFRPVPEVEKAEPARAARPVRGRPAAKRPRGKAIAKPPRADRRPRPATGTGTGTRTNAVRGVSGRRRRTP